MGWDEDDEHLFDDEYWQDLDDADLSGAGLARRADRPGPNGNACSTVFSLRLERDEHRRLVALARSHGLGPTVMARALIRAGLRDAAAG